MVNGVNSIREAQDRNIGFGKNRGFPVAEQISSSQKRLFRLVSILV
jgi:hypothetical protein